MDPSVQLWARARDNPRGRLLFEKHCNVCFHLFFQVLANNIYSSNQIVT